jgi:hypothetical protein
MCGYNSYRHTDAKPVPVLRCQTEHPLTKIGDASRPPLRHVRFSEAGKGTVVIDTNILRATRQHDEALELWNARRDRHKIMHRWLPNIWIKAK